MGGTEEKWLCTAALESSGLIVYLERGSQGVAGLQPNVLGLDERGQMDSSHCLQRTHEHLQLFYLNTQHTIIIFIYTPLTSIDILQPVGGFFYSCLVHYVLFSLPFHYLLHQLLIPLFSVVITM